MLGMMRKHSQSFLIYLIFGAIIVVFAINFGPGSGGCGASTGDFAAKVDGDVIPRRDFELRYSRQLDTYRRNFGKSGGELTPEMAERLGLKTQVIDDLINRKLLAHAADRHGLRVSDDELLETLKDTYKVEDVSYEQYQNWVEREFQTTVPRFEDELRADLVGQKLAKIVTDSVSVSDDELKGDYLRDHDRAMITYVKLDPQAIDVPEPSKAAIDDLLAKKLEAVKERYEKDLFSYRTAKEVHVRQILRKLASDASDADVAKARALLLDLKSQIDGGADFASLAKQNSEDVVSQDKGGDLGFVKGGQLLKPINDAVFALKKGEMTDEPVRSPMGLHLLQVTDVKEPGRKEFVDVQRDIAKTMLTDDEREAKAKGEAEALLAKINGGTKLEDLTWDEQEARDHNGASASDKRPTRQTTAWILKNQDSIPQIGNAPEILSAVFTLSADHPVAPKVFQVGRAFYVVVLKERETPDLTKFQADIANLRDQAIWEKRSKLYRDWLTNLRQAATVELNSELFGTAPADKV